jgi:hypothetical protein
VFLQKLMVAQVAKEFPAFYGIRSCIIVFINPAISICCEPVNPGHALVFCFVNTPFFRLNLCLSKGSVSLRFSKKICTRLSHCERCIFYPQYLILFNYKILCGRLNRHLCTDIIKLYSKNVSFVLKCFVVTNLSGCLMGSRTALSQDTLQK